MVRQYCRKSKRGALRLETYLSTQPPAPGKNARLSYSHENSGGAQCVAAPPSEEPPSLDSLKRSFDLSSFPQDFSAATPKRVSAGLRRRAAPQRVTMHGLLPAQRVTTFTPGNHHAGARGECCPRNRLRRRVREVFRLNRVEPSGRLGHPGQSSRGGGESLLRHAPAGTVAAVSPAASRVGDRLQVTGNRENSKDCAVLCPVTVTFTCHEASGFGIDSFLPSVSFARAALDLPVPPFLLGICLSKRSKNGECGGAGAWL